METKPRIRVKMRKGKFVYSGGLMETFYGHKVALDKNIKLLLRDGEFAHKIEPLERLGDYQKFWVIYGS